MAWTSTADTIDSLIRDYLMQRGFNNSLRAFDNDLKNDKEKGFKAEKLLQQILSFVYNYDLDSLRTYWHHLDSRIFSRFEQQQIVTVKKMEYNLYKYYLVTCAQNGKKKELFEFFEKHSQELNNLSEWKDWFAFPFTLQPESNKLFSNYFTKAWSDTFIVSLQNFLAVAFACMPAPHLYDVIHQDKIKIEQLESEVKILKEKLTDLKLVSGSTAKTSTPNYIKSLGIPASLTEITPVIVQPSKKKTLGFPFSSTKKNTTTQAKPKGSPKPTSKTVQETTQAISEPSPIMHVPQESAGNQKSKKSGYQKQREELFSSVTSAPKVKSLPTREIISSSPLFSSSVVENSQPNVTVHPSNSTPMPSSSSHGSLTDIAMKVADLPKENVISNISGGDIIMPSPSESNSSVFIKSISIDNRPRHTHMTLSRDEFQEHHSAIIQGRFNATGETVASCDKDGIVKIWKHEPDPITVATVMSRSPFISLDWCKTASTSLLLLGSSAGILRLYDTGSKQIKQDISLSNNYSQVTQIACCATGDFFATSSSCLTRVSEWNGKGVDQSLSTSGRLEMWKLSNSQVEVTNILHESKTSTIPCLSFNARGDTLACGDSNGGLMIFDTRSGKMILKKLAHQGPVHSIEFVENHIFTLGDDETFQAWDLASMDQPIVFPIHSSASGPFELSGYGGYRQVHKPSGGKLFAFEPEGHHLLTCDGTTSVIYSVELAQASLKKEMTIVGHRSPIVSVDWVSALNCGHCLSGSMDGKIHITTLMSQ